MERKAFVISRATWMRGTWTESALLIRAASGRRPEVIGKMCCLGSIALQCGATPEDIADVTTPARLARRGVWIDALAPLTEVSALNQGRTNSHIASQMMHVNDNPDITDTDRERQLTTLAATIGWDLTFVD